MRKIIIIVLMILITGCGTKKMICELNVDNTNQNYKLIGKYEIRYQNNLVKNVTTTETYISDNSQVIEYFDKYLTKTYKDFNKNYGNISYHKTNKQNQISYKVVIDYSKIDSKKLVKNGVIDKSNIRNKNITISGLVDMYEAKGAKCN
jgi:hypothetical protein